MDAQFPFTFQLPPIVNVLTFSLLAQIFGYSCYRRWDVVQTPQGSSSLRPLQIPPGNVRQKLSLDLASFRHRTHIRHNAGDLFVIDGVPFLRQLCSRLGLGFQHCEMRWGINARLTQSHQTSGE